MKTVRNVIAATALAAASLTATSANAQMFMNHGMGFSPSPMTMIAPLPPGFGGFRRVLPPPPPMIRVAPFEPRFGAPTRPFGLNHETQVGAECLGRFGPTYAAAGCAASRWTADELAKCPNGIGTRGGCYGPSSTIRRHVENGLNDLRHGAGDRNDLVGKDGWVRRTFGF